MRNVIKLFTSLALFILLPNNANAQQYSQKQCSGTSMTRTIELDDSSETEKIKIDVAEDTKNLSFNVYGLVKSGSLTVEVYDPKGNKHGNFSVESQIKASSTAKEKVCGQMQRSIKDPVKGKWVIKLIPKNVTGEISMCASQS